MKVSNHYANCYSHVIIPITKLRIHYTLYYHIYKTKKTVYNIGLKSQIDNVTQNNYKVNRAK